jgi:hypothetical protein
MGTMIFSTGFSTGFSSIIIGSAIFLTRGLTTLGNFLTRLLIVSFLSLTISLRSFMKSIFFYLILSTANFLYSFLSDLCIALHSFLISSRLCFIKIVTCYLISFLISITFFLYTFLYSLTSIALEHSSRVNTVLKFESEIVSNILLLLKNIIIKKNIFRSYLLSWRFLRAVLALSNNSSNFFMMIF